MPSDDLSKRTEQRIELEDILDSSPVGIGWSNVDRQVEYVNNRFTQLFGYTLADLPDLDAWYHKAYPDPHYRETVIDPWHRALVAARQTGARPPDIEVNVTCKDGSERRVRLRASWVGNKRLVHFDDMTAQWQSERRNHAHDAMLAMVAKGAPLAEILHSVVDAIEAEDPTSRCSVLLLDEDGRQLVTGAAPHLPAFFNDAINGIELGVGSCGMAAHLGQRVIVEDIHQHEHWRGYRELAAQAGLAACWSEPILSSTDKVLGTFAIYHAHPASPAPEDLDRISFAANLAAIAIENRRAREQLVVRERAFRSLAENAPDNIARYDLEGRLIYLNPRMEQSLGLPADELLGKPPGAWFDNDRLDLYEDKIRQVATTGEGTLSEFEVPGRRGTSFQAIHMVAERDDAGTIAGVLTIGRDVTERKRMEEELQRQAHSDYLTGLSNRRHFIEQAEIELARFRRYGGALSLIMFDIDLFKRVNDTYGHNVGDLVLQKVSDICRTTLRDVDIVGRIGGEEFAVLLPQTDHHQAMEAAERLRGAIAAASVTAPGDLPVAITASFGLVVASENNADIDGLLIQADQALYLAKENGRNRICVAAQPK